MHEKLEEARRLRERVVEEMEGCKPGQFEGALKHLDSIIARRGGRRALKIATRLAADTNVSAFVNYALNA